MTDNKWNYFTESETKNLDTELVAMLDMARHKAGIPFIISSGFRTVEHNYAVGGADGSSHIKGLAVDLLCRTSNQLFHILDGLCSVGFKRIGVYFITKDGVPYPSHVHVDVDDTKPQGVVFLKWEGQPNQVVS